jgi:zinc protease
VKTTQQSVSTSRFGVDWTTDVGMRVLVEPSHALPLVDVELIIGMGAHWDPEGKEGTARLAARMLRMGTKKRSASEFESAIDGMGASLSIDVAFSVLRVHASVIRRSLPALLDLLGEMLTSPALREDDLGLVRRETLADFTSQRDNDRWLAARGLRSHLFGSHPYGRSAAGTEHSIEKIERGDIARFLEQALVGGNLVLGVAGDVRSKDLRPMVERAFGKIRAGSTPKTPVPEVRVEVPGRRVLIVDKPERTQTQIYVGSFGIRLRDPDFYPLQVANSAFGGTFSSRLVQEVRDKRGWSYSANARLSADEQRDTWSLYSHPSVENAPACIALQLELIEAFVAKGVTQKELSASRDYLIKSHAFDRDTATKRLEPRLDALVHGLPAAFYRNYIENVREVTVTQARTAVRTHLSAQDQSIVVVATARDLRAKLEKLPGVLSIETMDWTQV